MPVPEDDDFTMEQYTNNRITGNLFANNGNGADIIPGSSPGAVAETITTAHGKVVIEADGDFIYPPTIGYYGTDTFDYAVLDSLNGEHEATNFIQITDSGSDSLVRIDVNGGANSFVDLAILKGVTGLTDEAALVASGNLVVV